MKLIRINLLPYREIREQKQKKQFQIIIASGAIIGIVLAGLVYFALDSMIDEQNSRNSTLETGIQQLDRELEEIKHLNEQKRNLLARKQKVEELDVKRFEGARIIDTLDQLTPEGTYLVSVDPASGNRSSDTYAINGKALSNNKVAVLMDSLPSTGIFDKPELVNIKKGNDAQEFSLRVQVLESKTDTDGESSK